MKKKFNGIKKIIAILLTAITCLSLTACGNGSEPNGPESTGKYIVSNNYSDYAILIPKERDENLTVAIEELQYGIELVTGYKMATTTTFVEGRKYLSVGNTPLYQENKSAVDGDGLGVEDVRVLTVGDNIIMIGGDSEYTVYAVYDFMEISFGLKWYTYEDCKYEETDKIELLNIDSKNTPAMSMRCMYSWDYWIEDRVLRCRRMRVHDFDENHFIMAGHNMIGVVMPKGMYASKHPEWYSKPTGGLSYTEAGQLCVTNPELIEEFIRRTKYLIEENWGDGTNKYFMIGMEDAWDPCECDRCMDRLKVNGNHAGNYIEFGNTVSRAINAWVKEKDPNKTIYFPMYAYFHTEEAPVKMENGKYVPYSKTAIPDPEVIIMLAPLNNPFTYAFDDVRNVKTYYTLQKWHAICNNNFMMYSYSYTGGGFTPMNDLVTMGGSIGQGLDNNYYGWIEEDGTYYRKPAMHRLRTYIRAQMFWGNSKNVDELAYEFIDFYYGPVAQQFKEYYSKFKQWQVYQIEELGANVSIMGTQYTTTKNWPIKVIDDFDAQLDAIIEDLAYLESTDNDLYKKYFDRVNVEKIWTYGLYTTLHGKYFNDTDFNEMVDFLLRYTVEYRVSCQPDILNALEAIRR